MGRSYIATNQINRHSHFGHSPEKAIDQTGPLVKGLGKCVLQHTVNCDLFLENKSRRESRKPADKGIRCSRERLDRVHSYLRGPIGIPSIGKSRYFLNIYDDTSAVSLVRFIVGKDQTSWALNQMITELESVALNRKYTSYSYG